MEIIFIFYYFWQMIREVQVCAPVSVPLSHLFLLPATHRLSIETSVDVIKFFFPKEEALTLLQQCTRAGRALGGLSHAVFVSQWYRRHGGLLPTFTLLLSLEEKTSCIKELW